MNLNFLKSNKKNILSKTAGLVLINMSLAIIVFFKEVFFAFYLGTSAQSDALLLAFFLPDTIGNNLLAGAMGIACIPVFARIYVSGNWKRLNQTAGFILVLFLSAAILTVFFGYFFKNEIISSIGGGLSSQNRSLCINLFSIVIPITVIFPLVSVGSSLMQVHGHFYWAALAPIFFNTIFLFSISWGYFFLVPVDKGVYLLAWSILAGVISMGLLILCGIKRKTNFSFNYFDLKIPHSVLLDIKDILKLLFPYLIILLSAQIVFFAERYFASYLGVGSISGLNYSYRLSQFPLWVFVAAISTVVFPSIAKFKESGQHQEAISLIQKTLLNVLLITIPLALFMSILREPIVSAIFQRGAFGGESVEITAQILQGYALSIIGQGLVVVCLRFFLAQNITIIPMTTAVFISIVNVVLDYYFIKLFGPKGIGYGAALAALLNGLLLIYILRKDLRLHITSAWLIILKLLMANTCIFIFLVLFQKGWLIFEAKENQIFNFMFVLCAGSICFIVYVLLIIRLNLTKLHLKGGSIS